MISSCVMLRYSEASASCGARSFGVPQDDATTYARVALWQCSLWDMRRRRSRFAEVEPIDRPLVADEIERPARVAAEGGDLLRRCAELADGGQLAVGLRQAPDAPGGEVGADVDAVEVRIARARVARAASMRT